VQSYYPVATIYNISPFSPSLMMYCPGVADIYCMAPITIFKSYLFKQVNKIDLSVNFLIDS